MVPRGRPGEAAHPVDEHPQRRRGGGEAGDASPEEHASGVSILDGRGRKRTQTAMRTEGVPEQIYCDGGDLMTVLSV
jgi:hypothetical protein